MPKEDKPCAHDMRFHSPYNCLIDFKDEKDFISDRVLDLHALGVILLEILVGTDIVLSCYDSEVIDEIITACEDYIDKEPTTLLHQLCIGSDDSGLSGYLNKIIKVKPELISENIRALNYAAEENRSFIRKKSSFEKTIVRIPGTLKDKFGVEIEDINRFQPEIVGDFEVYSEPDSMYILGFLGKLIKSCIFKTSRKGNFTLPGGF